MIVNILFHNYSIFPSNPYFSWFLWEVIPILISNIIPVVWVPDTKQPFIQEQKKPFQTKLSLEGYWTQLKDKYENISSCPGIEPRDLHLSRGAPFLLSYPSRLPVIYKISLRT